jgi:hypothetical protein
VCLRQREGQLTVGERGHERLAEVVDARPAGAVGCSAILEIVSSVELAIPGDNILVCGFDSGREHFGESVAVRPVPQMELAANTDVQSPAAAMSNTSPRETRCCVVRVALRRPSCHEFCAVLAHTGIAKRESLRRFLDSTTNLVLPVPH